MSKKVTYGIGIGVSVAAVLVVTVVAWLGDSLPKPPDPQTATVQEKAEYLATDRFGDLEVDEKREYLEQLRQETEVENQPRPLLMPDLTDAQRDQMIKNMMPVISQWVNERWAEYETLSPSEQQARLDQVIDRIEEYRQQNPQAYRDRMKRFTPERLNMFLEHTDPKTRSKISRFRTALEQRMKERGVPIDF